jgi:hypothetical protein
MSRPLIILTCMRSYSSLTCGMLGQHPELYGLPEINPFVADTIGETMRQFRSVRPRSLDGICRTIAQLEFGGQTRETITDAREWLQRRSHWSAGKLLDHIAEAVAPKAWVDKSISTVLREDRLRRAIRIVPDARFLHLTRHPRPTCRSLFELQSKNKARSANENGSRSLPDPDPDPEEAWMRTNQNVLRFVAELPPGQCMHIRGEDLLSEPERYLEQICTWLGIRFDDDALTTMLHPEASVYARIGPRNAPFGNDPNFLRNPVFDKRAIPAASLAGPLEWRTKPPMFARETVETAQQLGYR